VMSETGAATWHIGTLGNKKKAKTHPAITLPKICSELPPSSRVYLLKLAFLCIQ
jgi:hypothetical protein